jgi:hypothetical protein
MVTRNAAEILGPTWSSKVGQIKPGMVADLLVLDASVADPYRNLINGVEHNVQLVLKGGKPLYGDQKIMESLQDPKKLEILSDLKGRPKSIDTGAANLPKGTATLADVAKQLSSDERYDPTVLAARINAEPPGQKGRQNMKTWLATQLEKLKEPVPADLKDMSKPITAAEVAQYLKLKYPNAVPVHGVISLFQENDASFFTGFENGNLKTMVDLKGLDQFRTGAVAPVAVDRAAADPRAAAEADPGLPPPQRPGRDGAGLVAEGVAPEVAARILHRAADTPASETIGVRGVIEERLKAADHPADKAIER